MKKIYVKEEWCLGCHLCEYECAYANSGIGNIVERAKQVTGMDRVLGVIGGFHLRQMD